MQAQMENEYFDWLYNLVCDDRYTSYRKLLSYLHNRTFEYILVKDKNRFTDGMDFRYVFGAEYGYTIAEINEHLNIGPCSILELMVSMAYIVEEQIMNDDEYGDRTGEWFWTMIVSLGLSGMEDDRFDRRKFDIIIHKFINRDYEYNGEGGLFTVKNPLYDMRKADIWCQFMWYLSENYDFSL